MRAVYGEVSEIKELRSTQVCRISIEVPAETYKAAVEMLHGQKVLVTVAPAIAAPYGVVEPTAHEQVVNKAPKVDKAGPLGPLAKWAVMRCNDAEFRLWLGRNFMTESKAVYVDSGLAAPPEDLAKGVILKVCGIASRKELDTDQRAAEIFDTMIRRPYADEQG